MIFYEKALEYSGAFVIFGGNFKRKLKMRNILIFLVIAVLSGCAPKLIPTDRKIYTSTFDFRKYTKDGFFISSTPYIGNFDPIGELQIHVNPAKKVESVKGTTTTVKAYVEENINLEELLDFVVAEAKQMGADGLVNLSVERITEKLGTASQSYTETTHILKGFAIKRK